MKNIHEIKNDATLEPFFLDYIRCAEESYDIPEELPKGISEEEAEKIIKLAYKTDVALMNLVDEINDKYETKFDIDEINDDDEIANILNDTCDLYIEKHTIEKITARPLEFINDDTLDLTDMMLNSDEVLDTDANFCTSCNKARVEVDFEALPDEIKSEVEKSESKAVYFLFCPDCEEYSVISSN
jgi:hypothetical protein